MGECWKEEDRKCVFEREAGKVSQADLPQRAGKEPGAGPGGGGREEAPLPLGGGTRDGGTGLGDLIPTCPSLMRRQGWGQP